MKNAIEAAGLEEDITLVGHRSDLREVMAVSDVVVSFSTDPEAFGRVTLEALAIGKPVASYDHGGVHEQLDALFPAGKVPVGKSIQIAELLARMHNRRVFPSSENCFLLSNMLDSIVAVYQQQAN